MPSNMENLSSSGYNFTKRLEIQSLETDERVSLVEKMKPTSITTYIGQKQIVGPGMVLNHLLEKGEIPSMIFWGPPGCGKVKTSFIFTNCFSLFRVLL